MSDSTLLTLDDEVRGKTLELLSGVGEHESLWSRPGLHNSIRWHAGQGQIPENVAQMEGPATNEFLEAFVIHGGGSRTLIVKQCSPGG